jgi:hypothetical protein
MNDRKDKLFATSYFLFIYTLHISYTPSSSAIAECCIKGLDHFTVCYGPTLTFCLLKFAWDCMLYKQVSMGHLASFRPFPDNFSLEYFAENWSTRQVYGQTISCVEGFSENMGLTPGHGSSSWSNGGSS